MVLCPLSRPELFRSRIYLRDEDNRNAKCTYISLTDFSSETQQRQNRIHYQIMVPHPLWKELNIAVIGGGIGGLSAATSLRRAGHRVTIYERADFAGEVGASISCAANGTRWLEEWKVYIPIGRPVILEKLISHDWKTGEVVNEYTLDDYEDKWGYVNKLYL